MAYADDGIRVWVDDDQLIQSMVLVKYFDATAIVHGAVKM